jgi:RNA polymerase sigma-70 factor (ECF subfamily)
MTSMHDPEAKIEQARGSGDLGLLLDDYRNYLTLLARVEIGRRLQGKVDASDLVQETFLEAHRHFENFRGDTEAQFAAWLRQILATRVANLVRRFVGAKARDIRLEQQLAEELNDSSKFMGPELSAAMSSPSHQAAKREQGVLLAEALARLPEQYRETIVLRHLEGLTFPQIAEKLGRSVDAVQKLWLRGLARLRHEFGANE